jgi:hypothetical protein
MKVIYGHHDNIREFSRHEFQLKSKTVCAGCFGLLLGALTSLAIILIYSIGNIELDNIALLSVELGMIVVSSGLLIPILLSGHPIIRVLLNFSFVVGMVLILIGIDSIAMNLEIEIILIGFFIIWMMSRIMISRFNHKRIYSIVNS